jgi:hypothetical protein
MERLRFQQEHLHPPHPARPDASSAPDAPPRPQLLGCRGGGGAMGRSRHAAREPAAEGHAARRLGVTVSGGHELHCY